MLSKPVRSIMLRVIKRRMEAGENLEDILAGYNKLTDDEKADLKKSIDEEGA